MIRPCHCKVPIPWTNPLRIGTCVVCGFKIPPEWWSSEITVPLARIASSFPTVPDSFESLRSQCLERELAGRERFGFRFHRRNNIKDAKEEDADAMNYTAFDWILARKAGDEERADRDLNAMVRRWEAYDALCWLEAS